MGSVQIDGLEQGFEHANKYRVCSECDIDYQLAELNTFSMIQPDTTPLSSRYSMRAINPKNIEVSPMVDLLLCSNVTGDWKITYHQRVRMGYNWYPLVNVPIAIERSTSITGKTHYFYGPFQ